MVAKKNEIKVRRIPVKIGDVFGFSVSNMLVVAAVGALRADVRYVESGRQSKIQIRRLQEEYPRASEREAAAAHRALRRLERSTR